MVSGLQWIFFREQHPEQNCCIKFFGSTCNWRYYISKTTISADVSTFQNLRKHQLDNQASDHAVYVLFSPFHTVVREPNTFY